MSQLSESKTMEVSIYGKSYIIPNSSTIMEELLLPSFLNRICWEELLLDKAIRKSELFFYNRLFMISYDEKFAKVSGISVTFYQFLISLILFKSNIFSYSFIKLSGILAMK